MKEEQWRIKDNISGGVISINNNDNTKFDITGGTIGFSEIIDPALTDLANHKVSLPSVARTVHLEIYHLAEYTELLLSNGEKIMKEFCIDTYNFHINHIRIHPKSISFVDHCRYCKSDCKYKTMYCSKVCEKARDDELKCSHCGAWYDD